MLFIYLVIGTALLLVMPCTVNIMLLIVLQTDSSILAALRFQHRTNYQISQS